ncbi:MAG TPA: AAA family ATPase, partial [Chitinispirillaceae bacterium]|nr:AAA family ATPase [Chitinispirillaceae bacterium]
INQLKLKHSETININEYPYSLSIIKNIEKIVCKKSVTFIVGENGSGKSTFLEALALHIGLNAEGGNQNMRFATRDSHSDLFNNLIVSKGIIAPKEKYFLRAESFYNVASAIDDYEVQDSYGGKSLHNQSHGEAFLSVFMNKFKGNGLYILDEPEAALSPTRQMSLLTRMNDLINTNSQFIIATHSPIIMSFPNATIYNISNNEILEVNYEETEHFQITKMYLNNYGQMIKELLAD